jgi:hypothetical protein
MRSRPHLEANPVWRPVRVRRLLTVGAMLLGWLTPSQVAGRQPVTPEAGSPTSAQRIAVGRPPGPTAATSPAEPTRVELSDRVDALVKKRMAKSHITALGTEFPPYRTDEGLIRRCSTALLLGLPLLQLATVVMVARARRRVSIMAAVSSATALAVISIWLFLRYAPAQSTLPLWATWQTLPDIATVTPICITLTVSLVAVVSVRLAHHGRRPPPAQRPVSAAT